MYYILHILEVIESLGKGIPNGIADIFDPFRNLPHTVCDRGGVLRRSRIIRHFGKGNNRKQNKDNKKKKKNKKFFHIKKFPSF